MKLIFVCPRQNAVFETGDFRVIDNRGVITDAAGNKRLDAKGAIEHSCPICGEIHVYPASELACPFGGHKPEGED